jgi:hypothetical protein
MPLYLVQHTHTAQKCPTKSPEMVRQLSAHMTAANAGRFGVKLLADWVNEAEHTVVLVLEADSRTKVAEFVQPFQVVGSVTIKEGTTCEQVARQCLGG